MEERTFSREEARKLLITGIQGAYRRIQAVITRRMSCVTALVLGERMLHLALLVTVYRLTDDLTMLLCLIGLTGVFRLLTRIGLVFPELKGAAEKCAQIVCRLAPFSLAYFALFRMAVRDLREAVIFVVSCALSVVGTAFMSLKEIDITDLVELIAYVERKSEEAEKAITEADVDAFRRTGSYRLQDAALVQSLVRYRRLLRGAEIVRISESDTDS